MSFFLSPGLQGSEHTENCTCVHPQPLGGSGGIPCAKWNKLMGDFVRENGRLPMSANEEAAEAPTKSEAMQAAQLLVAVQTKNRLNFIVGFIVVLVALSLFYGMVNAR